MKYCVYRETSAPNNIIISIEIENQMARKYVTPEQRGF